MAALVEFVDTQCLTIGNGSIPKEMNMWKIIDYLERRKFCITALANVNTYEIRVNLTDEKEKRIHNLIKKFDIKGYSKPWDYIIFYME